MILSLGLIVDQKSAATERPRDPGHSHRYCIDVNVDWMRQKLEHFLELCEEYNRRDRAGGSNAETLKPVYDAIAEALPTVEQIIRQLDPRLLTKDFGRAMFVGMGDTPTQTRKALAVLRDREDWKTNLAPDAPSLTADQLHPTIWNAAATVWETGEYKVAAQQACVSLSTHIKVKAGSHLNDRELVTQAFSPDPPKPNQRRLHFPGNPADKNWQSRQQGLHQIAQGAFAGIRNIAAHEKSVWTEHEALEHLAVLSVVARWT